MAAALSDPLLAVIAALGAIAGALTTVSGFGGGLVLVVCFAAIWDPAVALTLTSLALLFGNLHRVSMLRGSVAFAVVLPYLAGAVPGALAGAVAAVALPAWVVHALILGGIVLAYARAFGWLRWSPSARSLAPAGVGVGVVTATSGGGGLLQGPLFLAAGLSGDAFVATMSFAAMCIHLGRVIGYTSSGLVSVELLVQAAVLIPSLVAGNLVGRALSRRLGSQHRRAIELTALTIAAAVGILGLASG